MSDYTTPVAPAQGPETLDEVKDPLNPNVDRGRPDLSTPQQSQQSQMPVKPPEEAGLESVNPYEEPGPPESVDSLVSESGQHQKLRRFIDYARRNGIEIDENEEMAKLNTAQWLGLRTGISTEAAYQNLEAATQAYFGMAVPPRTAWQSIVDEGRTATQSVKASQMSASLMVRTDFGSEEYTDAFDEYMKYLSKMKTYDNSNQPLWAQALGAGAAFVPSIGSTMIAGLLGALAGTAVGNPGIGYKVGSSLEAFRLSSGAIYGDILTTLIPQDDGSDKTLYEALLEDVPEEKRGEALKRINSLARASASVGGVLSASIELAQVDALIGGELLDKIVTRSSGSILKDLMSTKALANKTVRFLGMQGLNVAENTIQELTQENIEWASAEIVRIAAEDPDIGKVPRTTWEQWENNMKQVAVQAAVGSFVIGMPGAAIRSNRLGEAEKPSAGFAEIEGTQKINADMISSLEIEVTDAEKDVIFDEIVEGNASPINVWVDEDGTYKPADRRAQAALSTLQEIGMQDARIRIVEKPDDTVFDAEPVVPSESKPNAPVVEGEVVEGEVVEEELDYDAAVYDEEAVQKDEEAPVQATEEAPPVSSTDPTKTAQEAARGLTRGERIKRNLEGNWKDTEMESRVLTEWKRQALMTGQVDTPAVNAITDIAKKFADYLGMTIDEFIQTAFRPEAFIYNPEYVKKFGAKAVVVPDANTGKVTIVFSDVSDTSSLVHEFSHVMRRYIKDEHLEKLQDHYGGKFWSKDPTQPMTKQERIMEEQFAEDFEKYMLEGISPTEELKGVFEILGQLMKDIYGAIKNTLSPETRQVFNEILGMDKELASLTAEREIAGIDMRETLDAAREKVRETAAKMDELHGEEVKEILEEEKNALAQSEESWNEGLGKALIGKGNLATEIVGLKVVKDEEAIKEVRKKYGLNETGRNSVSEVHKLLSKLTGDAATEASGVDLTKWSPETVEVLAERLAAEGAWAIDNATKDAIGWYNKTLSRAMKKYSEYFPELEDDRESQLMFKAALAITSQGMDVFKNSELALKAYKGWRKTGKFKPIGKGDSAKAMKSNFKKMNAMAEELGPELLEEFMTTYFTIAQMEAFGYNPKEELKTARLPGAAVLGPKIGAGFFSNLFGNYDVLTMDLWFVRTLTRHQGNAADIVTDKTLAKNRDDVRKIVKSLEGSEIERLLHGVDRTDTGEVMYEFERKYTKEELLEDDEVLMEWANEVRMGVNYVGGQLTKDKVKKPYDIAKGKERAVIKKYIENITDTRKAPKNATERQYVRDTIDKSVRIMKDAGYTGITAADLQAVLWFLEKDLYETLGAANKKSESADYFDAAVKGLKNEKPDTRRNASRTRREESGVRLPEDGPEDQRGNDQRLVKWDSVLTPPANQSYPERSSGPFTRRDISGSQAVLVTGDKATPIAAYTPNRLFSMFSEKMFVNIDEREEIIRGPGERPHVFFEFDGETDYKAFHGAISKAVETQGDLGFMVEIKNPDDYKKFRLFMNEDGSAGFAIDRDTGDIVSGFRNVEAGPKGVMNMMMPMAIQLGGRRLDCYDTILPYIYGQFGFVAVARLKFDEKQASKNWNYDHPKIKKYNNGRPDIVFMALSASVSEEGWLDYENYKEIREGRKTKKGKYNPKHGKKLKKYNEGFQVQSDTIDDALALSQSITKPANFTRPLPSEEYMANQRRWVGESKLVDSNGNPPLGYHASAVPIVEFDPAYTNEFCAFGKGIYIAESPIDASVNYASDEGPDVAAKIHNKEDEFIDNAQDYPENYIDDQYMKEIYWDMNKTLKTPPDSEFAYWIQNHVYDISYSYAKKQVLGYEQIHEVITRMMNPYDEFDTMFDISEESEEMQEFTRAMIDIGIEPDKAYRISGDILERHYGETLNGIVFKRTAEGALERGSASNDLDIWSPMEMFRLIIEEMGFDGAVQYPENYSWGSWTLSRRHFIAFDPTNIKSTSNRGTWQDNDPNILSQSQSHEEAVRKAVRDRQPVADNVLDDYKDTTWANNEIKRRARIRKDFGWIYQEAREAESWEDLKKRVEEDFTDLLPKKEPNDKFYQDVYKRANITSRTDANKAFLASIDSPESIRDFILALSKGYEKIKGIGLHPRVLTAARRGVIGRPSDIDVIQTLIMRRPEVYRKALALATGDEEAAGALNAEYEVEVLEADNVGRVNASASTRMGVAARVNDPDLRRKALAGKATGVELRALAKKAQKMKTDLEQDIARLAGEVEKAKEGTERKKKVIENLREKERQRIEAQQYQRDIANIRAYRIKLGKKIAKKIPKSVDYYAAKAIEELRAPVDAKMRSAEKIAERKELLANIEADPALKAIMKPSELNELMKKSLSEFSITELEDLVFQIEALKAQGKAVKAARDAKRKSDLNEVAADGMMKTLDGEKSKVLEGVGSKEAEKIRKGQKKNPVSAPWGSMKKGTFRPPRIFRDLFGEDSQMYEWFVRKVNRATDRELKFLNERKKKLDEVRKKWGISDRVLATQETFEGLTYTKDEIIHIYLGMKNEKSAAAIQYGNRLTVKQINHFVSTLSTNEKKFGDHLLKDFDDNYHRLREAYINYANEDLGKEENYFPMLRLGQTFEKLDQELADQMMSRNAWGKAFVDKKFSISRINIADEHQSAIRLGAASIWLDQIEKQEHFIQSGQLTKDLHAIIGNKDLKNAIIQKHGAKMNDWLAKYVNDFANPYTYKMADGMSKLFSTLKSNYALGALSLNALTVLKQIPSITLFLSRVGPMKLMASVGEFLGSPKKMIELASSKDPQMKDRSGAQYLEYLKAKTKQDDVSRVVKGLANAGMKPIQTVDKWVTTIGWNAVYKDHLARGFSEEQAIEAAQMAVLETQPAGRSKDLAEIYRTDGAMGWFVMFSNQLNQIWNLNAADLPAAVKARQFGEALGIVTGSMIGFAAMSLASGFQLPEDGEDIPEEVMMELLKNMINTIPLVGGVASSAMGEYGYGGISPFPAAEAVGEFTAFVFKDDKTKEDWGKQLGNLAKGAGFTVGAPTVAIDRVFKATKRLSDEEYILAVSQLLLGSGITNNLEENR